MTKYDDPVVTRCPECGTVVQLTDDRCPRCDCFLAYGHNVKKDRRNLCYKYQKLPRWTRACFLGFTLALFASAFVFSSITCLLISFILFISLLILGKHPIIGFIMGVFIGDSYAGLHSVCRELEPWDKTLLEADGTEKKTSAAG